MGEVFDCVSVSGHSRSGIYMKEFYEHNFKLESFYFAHLLLGYKILCTFCLYCLALSHILLSFYKSFNTHLFSKTLNKFFAAPWRKRLDAWLPPLGPRVRVSVTTCGFRGERNWVWVGFTRGFSRLLRFSTLISFISFHFISPCDSASGVVGRYPFKSLTFRLGASSHHIPRPDPVFGHELIHNQIFDWVIHWYYFI